MNRLRIPRNVLNFDASFAVLPSSASSPLFGVDGVDVLVTGFEDVGVVGSMPSIVGDDVTELLPMIDRVV